MKRTYRFDISEIKFQDFLDQSTALVLVKVCTSGDNAHDLPFSADVLKEAAERSLRGKPIVAKYNDWKKDFEGHHPAEIPIGYFIEHQDFKYIENDNGTCSLYAFAVLWKSYAPKQYDVFVRKLEDDEEPQKGVSMEIYLLETKPTDSDKTEVLKFSFKGVTIIGDNYTPASEGSYAEMVCFTSAKKKEVEKYFTEVSDKINYGEDGHSNLLSYLKELGLSTKNIEEKEGETMSIPAEGESKEFELEIKIQEEEGKEPQEEGKENSEKLEPNEDEKSEEGKKEEEFEEPPKVDTDDTEEKDYKALYEEMCGQYAQMSAEFEVMKSSSATYMAENESLKEYKKNREEQDKKFEIEKTFAAVADILPKDIINEYRNRVDEVKFSEVVNFCNEIKSRVVDFADFKHNENNNRMSVIVPQQEEKKKRFW